MLHAGIKRKNNSLRGSEYRVLRIIFIWLARQEIMQEWRKLHNKRFTMYASSKHMVRKSRKKR
jgi:hypothetical protein